MNLVFAAIISNLHSNFNESIIHKMYTIRIKTRIHSSRMRTGRTLTVFRCLVPPSKKIGEPPEKLEPLHRKIGDPSQKIGDPSQKIGDPSPEKLETLPKNWRPLKNCRLPGTRLPPPRKIGDPPRTRTSLLGLTCKACWDTHPPPWTEWMTDRCKNITLAKTSFRPVITELLCSCSELNFWIKLTHDSK